MSAAFALAGCGDNPSILLDVARDDTGTTLNVFTCPSTKPATCKDGTYDPIPVFDVGSALVHRTVGIYVRDATPSLQLDLQQTGGDGRCQSVVVSVGGDTANVGIKLGSPLKLTCDASRCGAPGGC